MGHAMRFAGLLLDEDALHTPNGIMPLSEITRAEFVREMASHGSGSAQETSAPAVVGGAAAGGVLFGPVGMVAGGLLGSTVKEEGTGRPKYHTKSVKIVFETDSQSYSMDIERDQEARANDFAKAVHKAARHRR